MKRPDHAVPSTIYALLDPREPDHVRYVGKTIGCIEKRRKSHVRESKRVPKHTHRYHWIRSLLAESVEPEVTTLDSGSWTNDEHNEREESWIQRLRADGHKLVNGTKGGDGGRIIIFDDTRRQQWSEAGKKAYATGKRDRALAATKEFWATESEQRARAIAAWQAGASRPEVRAKIAQRRREIYKCDECDYVNVAVGLGKHQKKFQHQGRTLVGMRL